LDFAQRQAPCIELNIISGAVRSRIEPARPALRLMRELAAILVLAAGNKKPASASGDGLQTTPAAGGTQPPKVDTSDYQDLSDRQVQIEGKQPTRPRIVCVRV